MQEIKKQLTEKVKKRITGCAGKPPDHGGRESSKQIFGHTWKEGTRKAQVSPAYTQPIQDTMRSWVRGKRAWFGGGEREIPILRFLPGLFWEKRPVGMTHHPNG